MAKNEPEIQASAKSQISHLEDQAQDASKEPGPLKLDTHGLPLRPQPSGTLALQYSL